MGRSFYDPDWLPAGNLLKERYEICDVLDQIGDRIIYEGKDKILGRDVVIQEFYPVELVYRFGENLRIDAYKGRTEKLCIRRERFCKEAKVLERFKKLDGLVTPIDFFEANNTAYTIMRHLGETITLGKLSKIMREYKMIDVIVLLECLLPVMNGIAALHREGLLHCDINPSSIIVLNDCTMKLLVDAGKRLIKDPIDAYYAPEIYSAEEKMGPWTDIYALCGTMYYYISGYNPFQAQDRIAEKKTLKDNTSIFSELENVILKGVSVDIKDRYQSMEEFCEALYGVANEIRDFN